ncbi:hypothetical protein VTN96DRAFT_1314 [Rasamsonia emersonii]
MDCPQFDVAGPFRRQTRSPCAGCLFIFCGFGCLKNGQPVACWRVHSSIGWWAGFTKRSIISDMGLRLKKWEGRRLMTTPESDTFYACSRRR